MICRAALSLLTLVFILGPPNSANAQTASAQAEDNGGCIYCSYCEEGGEGHDAENGPGDYKNPHEVCVPYPGCGHPSCGSASLTPADLERIDDLNELLDRATGAETEVLAHMLTEFPDMVGLNLEREAVQVRSACPESSVLIAHIPLSSEQVAVLVNRRPDSTILAAR